MDEKIQQMQFLEQNLNAILMQKQAFQMELSETEDTLKEVGKNSEDVYKIVGQLMIKAEREEVKKELESKKKIVETRIKALESQEKTLKEQTEKLRKEIIDSSKK
jgi:prefoldin beta subunit